MPAALEPAARAEPLGVDWKFYGGAQLGDGQAECFFDAAGVAKEANGLIRVWTKCLLQKDMDRVDIEKDYGGRIAENAGRKLVIETYTPPISKVESLNYDRVIDVTALEQTADIAPIEPVSRIFYELDCSKTVLRELSLYVKSGGKDGFVHEPSDWIYVSPETNGGRLVGILCSTP
jgi:hypothetical protein